MPISNHQPRMISRKSTIWSLLIVLAIFLSLIKPSIARSAVPLVEYPSGHPGPLSQITAIPVCPPTLNFGEAIECSIQTGGERDTYTFAATANDMILIRMVRTSGTFEPEFKIYNSNGVEVCGGYGAPVTGKTCQLAYGGTYTLLAFESFNRLNTGNYTLYLQRLNNPGIAQPIDFGQALTGTIATGGEFDTYTFSAIANDQVMLRVVRTTGTFEPEFKVFDARGIEVCGGYGAPVTGKTCQLADNASYTLLVFESFSRTNTGNYTLYLQRLNNPGNALPIGFGQTLSGAIDLGGEFDTYTFSGAVNDKILLRMTRTSGTFEPEIKVFDPRGVEVCGSYGAPVTQISSCQLAYDGTYTLLAFESFSRINTGGYILYLQCVNSSCGSPTPPPGCEKSPTTGLDGCLLKPGDLLFVRGKGTFESLIKLGSWWSHVALYVGDGKIVQAIPYEDDTRDIEELDIKQSDWWRANANTYVQDWLVLRPSTSDDIKSKAVADAKRWAGPPELTYQTPIWDTADLNDETTFYCSKLVWRAYYRNGYDLDITRWQGFVFYEKLVTPGDLDNSQSIVIQRKQISTWRSIFLISPVSLLQYNSQYILTHGIAQPINPIHIMLIDPQGRRTGYDPSTGTVLSEIPGAVYEGINTPFENISAEGAGTQWKILLTGVSAGKYQLGAEYVDAASPQQQRVTGMAQPGQITTFSINNPGTGNSTILTPQNKVHVSLVLH